MKTENGFPVGDYTCKQCGKKYKAAFVWWLSKRTRCDDCTTRNPLKVSY